MENNHDSGWVAQQLNSIEPKWTPDTARARGLLDDRLQPRRFRQPWVPAMATAAMCLAVAALPQTRALAQELWSHYILHRVDVVRLDFSNSPLRSPISTGGALQQASDLNDTEGKAGFRPELPAHGVLPVNPSLGIIGAMTVEQTIHVAELRSALQKLGENNIQIPENWEGVKLRAQISPMVSLKYPDNIQILEAKPIEVSAPAGFPMARFAEAVFRSLGKSVQEAKWLADKFAANPALLIGIPGDEAASVEQVSLSKGPALLVEEANDDGSPGRVTVLRSTSERIYCVLTNSRPLAMRIAEALP